MAIVNTTIVEKNALSYHKRSGRRVRRLHEIQREVANIGRAISSFANKQNCFGLLGMLILLEDVRDGWCISYSSHSTDPLNEAMLWVDITNMGEDSPQELRCQCKKFRDDVTVAIKEGLNRLADWLQIPTVSLEIIAE